MSFLDKYTIHKQLGYFEHEKVPEFKRAIASNLVAEEEELAGDKNNNVVM